MTQELTLNTLYEELQEWKTEATFNLQREATYWAHSFGRIIREHITGELTEEIIQNLTHETGKSRATIFRWVELYDKYPDLEAEIEHRHKGNISITALLGKEKETKEKDPCKKCPLHCRGMKML